MITYFNYGLWAITETSNFDRACFDKLGRLSVFSSNCSYVQRLSALTEEIVNVNAHGLNIFRTTTAAWHKWGNWGFPWPDEFQGFRRSFTVIRSVNLMARNVLQFRFPNVTIVDGFETSVSRPDHTERQLHSKDPSKDTKPWRNHFIGGHLAHYQPDIPLLHNQALFQFLRGPCNSSRQSLR